MDVGDGSTSANATTILPTQKIYWMAKLSEMTTYYINMDTMPHRRKRMEQLLSNHNLTSRRIRATTPHDDAFAALTEQIKWRPQIAERHATKVSPPLRANMLSHAAIWKQIVERNEPISLVLEDDVMLLKDWHAELSRLLAAMPSDWDVFYLDSFPVESEWLFPFDCGFQPPTLLKATPPVLFLDAYLITPKAAKWLLHRHSQYPTAGGEDLMSDLQRNGKCFYTHPKKLCVQTWHESGISGAGFASSMAALFETYFHHIPKELYDDPPLEPPDLEAIDISPPPPAATVETTLLPLVVTTTSPNYQPCYSLFHSSLVNGAGYDAGLVRTQTLRLRPPFGVGTPSWHEAISKSLQWVLDHMGGEEAMHEFLSVPTSSPFLIKSDADIQYFLPFVRALKAWLARMVAFDLDLLCMREAEYEMVNGGFYIIRRSSKMRAFMRELMRRSREAPGNLHDQEHLNAMLGLVDAHSSSSGSSSKGGDGGGAVWDASVRFEILPSHCYVWAQSVNSIEEDVSTVCFHHAVAEHGVAGKVAQIARVRAEVELRRRDGRLATRLAPLRGEAAVVGGEEGLCRLAAYLEEHVATVVGWQHAEPELSGLLGLEEPESVEEEEEYVRHLASGEEPTTLIMVVLDGSNNALCGTVTAKFRLAESYPRLIGTNTAAAASLAQSLSSGSRWPVPLEVEVEVEIEKTHRRKGIGKAAVSLLLGEVSRALPEVAVAHAKVPITNTDARKFFEEGLGFGVASESSALGMVELSSRKPLTASITGEWKAYYINLDSRTDRREQMEAGLQSRGLCPIRIAACTPENPEVKRAALECPGKAIGWHANGASHAAIWQRIAKGSVDDDDGVAKDDGSSSSCGLHLVFEDDVILHEEWYPMLQHLIEHARKESKGGEGEQAPSIDLVMLDGLCMAGEASSQHGWLGASEEGPHRACGVCFSSAYALTPSAASWLLQRRSEDPHHNAEAYLMMLQEERAMRAWTYLPRLAIQRWDEEASSVSALRPQMMREWYGQNYFTRFPWGFYESEPLAVDKQPLLVPPPPTATALAGLGGGSSTLTEPPAVVDDDAASVATSASYFTNRWLPGGLLDAEQVGSTSTLSIAAPVFVPRAAFASRSEKLPESKKKLCRYWLGGQGFCEKGDACPFRHGNYDPRAPFASLPAKERGRAAKAAQEAKAKGKSLLTLTEEQQRALDRLEAWHRQREMEGRD